MKREDVEALLAECEPGSEGFLAAMDKLTRRNVKSLCRRWLAVEDAPVVVATSDEMTCLVSSLGGQLEEVTERWAEVHTDELPASFAGQRIRIVPESY